MSRNYELVRGIMLATNKVDGMYYLLGKQCGVNENTLAFLYALADEKPHLQKEIGNEWLIPRTTINSIVKIMLASGYIEFGAGSHREEKTLILTQRSREYADKRFSEIYAAEEKAILATLEHYPAEFVSALEDFGKRLLEEFQCISKKEANGKELSYAHSTFRPLYLRQIDSFYSARHRDDDFYVDLQRGGWILHFQLCGQNALCDVQPDYACFADSGHAGLYVRYGVSCQDLR